MKNMSFLGRVALFATALTTAGVVLGALVRGGTWCVRANDSVQAIPKIQAYLVENDQWRAVQDERWDEIHEWMRGMGDAMGVPPPKKRKGMGQ